MEKKIDAADAVTLLRGALVQAEYAIKGREHTGFITKALVATEHIAGIDAALVLQPAAPGDAHYQFRKKPVVIEAFQFAQRNNGPIPYPDWFDDALTRNDIITHNTGKWADPTELCYCEIETLEGMMIANVGDWIIRGLKGEIYPCRADIFAMSYESAASHAPAPPAGQGEPVATVTLGGVDGGELGDIDIECIDMQRLEALQYQMVRTSEPVCLHLYLDPAALPPAPSPQAAETPKEPS